MIKHYLMSTVYDSLFHYVYWRLVYSVCGLIFQWKSSDARQTFILGSLSAVCTLLFLCEVRSAPPEKI